MTKNPTKNEQAKYVFPTRVKDRSIEELLTEKVSDKELLARKYQAQLAFIELRIRCSFMNLDTEEKTGLLLTIKGLLTDLIQLTTKG